MDVVDVETHIPEQSPIELNAKIATPDANGNYPLEYDRQAARQYVMGVVNQNFVFFHDLKERLEYLFTNDYYDRTVFDQYSFEFLQKIQAYAYSFKFRFRTYVGAFKFFNGYALKTKDSKRWLERYEDRVMANALLLAQGDEAAAMEYVEEIISGRCQPATPTFSNAGKKSYGELVSCFLLLCDDSLYSIRQQWSNAAELSKIGGGVGVCITDVRESEAPIRGVAERSSGTPPVCKILEDVFGYVDQLGTRPGAGVVWISMLHLDAPALIEAKREHVDEQLRLKTLNVGLVIPDIAYELAEAGKDLCLFSTYDIFREYGIPMSRIGLSKRYYELVANPKIRRKKVNAAEYFQTLSGIQMESGYPFIMNEDTVNRANQIDGYISHSNLCSEIAQVSTHSTFHERLPEHKPTDPIPGTYEEVGRDISCNLLSQNVTRCLQSKDFGRTVRAAVRMCTAVSVMTNIASVPTVALGNALTHAIGVGAMNLHGAFAFLGFDYGDELSLQFTDVWFMAQRFYAIKASMELAIEKGASFYEFEKSGYYTGRAFRYYFKHDYYKELSPTLLRILEQFPGFHIPTVEEWKQLAADVRKNGMFNAYLMATAPTGSISYINDSTASIHPVSGAIEERLEGKFYAYYPAPGLTNENRHLYRNSFEVGARAVVDVYAEATKHTDQMLSMTLSYQQEGTTTRDICANRHYAWKKGIKSGYYVRARQDSLESAVGVTAPVECEACSV